jgi:hypothetical protein
MRAAPSGFNPDHHYPNPFHPNATIEYPLPVKSCISLTSFNTPGREALSPAQRGGGIEFN